MQNHSNQFHPQQPVQAPPLLQARVFERIRQAERISQERTNFTAAFTSSDWTLRLAAVEQLAQVERALALPWLERALADEHPSVRACAVHVAGQHQASAFIRSALSDPDWLVREAALLALKEQDTPLAENIPLAMQDDPDAAVSETARALAHQPSLHYRHAGDKPQMSPTTDQPTRPLPFESRRYEPEYELGTLQSRQQRPRRKRSRVFWSLVAASVALVLVLGNLIILKSLGQPGSQTANQRPLGTTLYAHSFPQAGKDSNDDIQLGKLAWSPNGQRLAVAAGPTGHGSVHIWDALTGAHEVVLTPPRSTNQNVDSDVDATEVAWSPDGKYLASSIGDVQIWNPATGALVKRLFPNVSNISNVGQIAWSPDGKYLAGAFNDSNGTGGIAIWNVSTGTLVKTLSASVKDMAWSPNGKYLSITGSDGVHGAQVIIWNTSNWSIIQGVDLWAMPLAWSPDSSQLAVGTVGTPGENTPGGNVEILAVSTGKVVLTYKGQDQQGSQALAWSPDGKRIVSASDVSIQIWSATSGHKLFTYPDQTGNAQGGPFLGDLAWSPDGQYIASSKVFFPNQGGGGIIKVWQAA